MNKNYFIFSLCLILSFNVIGQTAGMLDSTFNGTGRIQSSNIFQDIYNDVRIQSDQKIVASGVSLNSSYTGCVVVDRWNTDGSADTSFGTNGRVQLFIGNDSYAYDSYIRNDGKIIVAGIAYGHIGGFGVVLLQLNPNGSLDSTFGLNGVTIVDLTINDDFASAMAVQSDGKILISGTYTDTIYRNVPMVMRFTEQGQIDSTFGINGRAEIAVTGTDNELTSISVMGDGRIVAAGHYETAFTFFDVLLIRLLPNGDLDSTFGTDGVVIQSLTAGVEESFGMQLAANGKIVITGETTLPDFSFDVLLMQFDSTGALDAGFGNNGAVTFNNGVNDIGLDLEIQSDNKILVCGTSGGSWFDDRDFLLMRYNQDGTPDYTFGDSGVVYTQIDSSFDEANAMALQEDGKIVLAGKANDGVTNLDFAITRYYNDLYTVVQENPLGQNFSLYPNPIEQSSALHLSLETNKIDRLFVEWFSIDGRLAGKNESISLSSGKNDISLLVPQGIKKGVYFVRLSGTNLNFVQRVVVN